MPFLFALFGGLHGAAKGCSTSFGTLSRPSVGRFVLRNLQFRKVISLVARGAFPPLCSTYLKADIGALAAKVSIVPHCRHWMGFGEGQLWRSGPVSRPMMNRCHIIRLIKCRIGLGRLETEEY